MKTANFIAAALVLTSAPAFLAADQLRILSSVKKQSITERVMSQKEIMGYRAALNAPEGTAVSEDDLGGGLFKFIHPELKARFSKQKATQEDVIFLLKLGYKKEKFEALIRPRKLSAEEANFFEQVSQNEDLKKQLIQQMTYGDLIQLAGQEDKVGITKTKNSDVKSSAKGTNGIPDKLIKD